MKKSPHGNCKWAVNWPQVTRLTVDSSEMSMKYLGDYRTTTTIAHNNTELDITATQDLSRGHKDSLFCYVGHDTKLCLCIWYYRTLDLPEKSHNGTALHKLWALSAWVIGFSILILHWRRGLCGTSCLTSKGITAKTERADHSDQTLWTFIGWRWRWSWGRR